MSLLSKHSTPAERLRRCSFAEKFESPYAIAQNGGTLGGTCQFQSNGIRLATTSSYVNYPVPSEISNYSWASFGGVVEFTPEFAYDDGLLHYIMLSSAARYAIYKHNAANSNQLRIAAANTTVLQCSTSEYSLYWKAGQRNVLAWSCVSGAHYVYLNGNLVKTSATAFTPELPLSFIRVGNATDSFVGTIHSFKLFLPQSTSEALTAKDCEVLSAGTTYTYWKDATLVMTGLMADHDPTNYRALDRSGLGNHVLLGNGAGTGTPTKLAAQGYSFNGTTQYMTIPLAAWPGNNGTILIDYSAGGTVQQRIFSTDHSSGNNYECRTYDNSGTGLTLTIGGASGTIISASAVLPTHYYDKNILAGAWSYSASTTLRNFHNGIFRGSAVQTNAPATPDLGFYLMRWPSDGSYTAGSIRSVLCFSRTLSDLQIADAVLWMQKLRNKT
jgi:hypothetical protein